MPPLLGLEKNLITMLQRFRTYGADLFVSISALADSNLHRILST
jgi:hypothetical protein